MIPWPTVLHRDPSCLRDLLWRIALSSPEDAARLADRLQACGWQPQTTVPQVRDLEGPEGHRLVIVPRTGRVQLRVHYLTAPRARRDAARSVHRRVMDLLAEPPPAQAD